MTRDSFDIISDKELQNIENEMCDMFKEVGPAPLNEAFAEELRSKLDKALADSPEESPQRKGFFSKSFLADIKAKLKLPSLNFGGGRAGQKNLKLVASFALIVFMFTALFWGLGELGLFLKPAQAGEIKITALKEDKQGVATDSVFLLTSKNSLDESTVKDNLRISPSLNYKLEKKSGGREYRIVPQEQLAPDTVYKFGFDPTQKERDSYTWAFQTKGQFRIIRTLPGKSSSGVPVDTGLEIVFSHENFAVEKAAEFITVSPHTEGRFEQHKKTLVYVPKSLQKGTVYTVTVKKGFPLNGGSQVLADDYSFSFETQTINEDNEKFSFDLHNSLAEFTSTEAPVFPVSFYWRQGKAPQANITLYRYSSSTDFIASLAKIEEIPSWAYYSRINYREDLTRLTKHSEYTTDFISTDQYQHFLALPQPLPSGFYAAQIEAAGAVRQIWLQVSDLGVYVTQSKETSLFWVNSLASGAPAGGAKISLPGQNKSWQTDSQGAVLVTEKLVGEKRGFALAESGSQATVVPLDGVPGDDRGYNVTRDYWKYLYLDRELYKPGDTMHYWGVLSPRKGAVALNSMTLELRGTDGPYYEGAENSPIMVQQVKLQGQTFTGELRLPVLKPGYYYLSLKTGETELLARGFSVETYTKPSYQLTVEPEKKAVFAGEGMNFQVKASFFEGTPVPGLKLEYYIVGRKGTVVTDERGQARIPYVGKSESEYSPVSYVYLGVSAALPEAGEIHADSQVYVFPSKVNLEGKVERKGTSFTLRAKAQNVDLSRVSQDGLQGDNYLAGPAGDVLLKGKIIKDIWDKYEVGQYYDFISKKVQPRYEYRHSTQEVGELSTITGSDGSAVYTGTLDDPEASYYIVLTAQDSSGRTASRHIPIYSSTFRDYPGYNYYYLKDQRSGGYVTGENVQLSFMKNEQPLPDRNKGFLYYQAQKNLNSYSVSNSSAYGFTFSEEMLPNTVVYGVYFDGRTYQESAMQVVALAKESKGLKVTVTTDSQEYRPGQKVKLAVRVTDQKGQPVRAEVNLNLVDEALFALANQHVNLLQSLYGDYIIPYLNTWRSHNHPEFRGGAEQGGEGGGERRDFRDTVLFTTLTTGNDGQAAAEFTLPDNLTSWRVTYHALANGLQAASGTEKIPVRLPFFVDVTRNENYQTGDKPVLIFRAYGEKLGNSQAVSYQTSLVTPQGQEITGSGQGTSFTPFDYQLPTLEEGVYKLTVKASSGSQQDIVSLPIKVSKAVLERTITKQELLREGLQPVGSDKSITTLVFSDYEKAQYLTGLYDLSWSFGSRVEQQLAVREARKLLRQYFPKEESGMYPADEEETSLLQFQQPDGGISILPYSESELALSALAASYNSGDFDRRALAGYFYRVLEDQNLKEGDRTLALWGLAAVDQPVLLQIKSQLERTDLAPAERIQLAMALLESGDGAYGKQIFRQLIQQYGEDLGATMRIKGGKDQDEIVAATTQMALLAARLEEPEKGKLYQYILENPGQELLNTLEKLQILKYSLKYMQPQAVSFTYELNGQKTTKSLKGQEVFKLNLQPADLSSIKFSQIQGKVGLAVVYSEPLQPGEKSSGEDLSLARAYYVGGKYSGNSWQRGDLIQVAISYDIADKAPNGTYEIVDILPAGLAYVNRPYTRTEKPSRELVYPSEVNGQQLTFTVWKGKGRLVYYARVLTPGEYESGSPYLGSTQSRNIYIAGNKDRVVIK